MTTPFHSEEKFNELIFENRNKEYGAYVIRNSYNDTMTRSLLIVLAAVGALTLMAFLYNKNNSHTKAAIPIIETWDTTVFNATPPPIDLPKKTSPVLPQKTIPKSVSISYKPVDEPVTDPPKATSLVTPVKGDPKGTDVDTSAVDPGKIPGNITDTKPVETNKALVYADVMPVFKNMNQFIADNLRYPAAAVENGTNGIVIISFIVEKDGSVSDIKIARAIGDGCEEEALRVVKLMKLWEPGKIKNIPQRVSLNLPVRFRLK